MKTSKTLIHRLREGVTRAYYAPLLGLSMAMTIAPTPATAQSNDLADVSENLQNQLSAVGPLIITASAVIGIGLVAFGIFKLIMRRPGGQDSVGGAIGMIVGGSALLVISVIAGIGTDTLVEGDANSGLENLEGF